MTEPGGFWRVTSPERWPAPPDRFGISVLREIEACPQRWALAHGKYPQLLVTDGYPRKPALAALTGEVVHAALDRITRSFDAAGCQTLADVVKLLQSLGGISRVIEDCVTIVVARLSASARMQHRAPDVQVAMLRQIPELRAIVQLALNGILTVDHSAALVFRPRGFAVRGPLGLGYHSEVKLEPKQLHWVGFADAIRLTEASCEIIDYKTGNESLAHEDQLRTYALLWARDDVLNPAGRLPTRLALVYPGFVHEVRPPSERELDELEVKLLSRSAAAKRELATKPPPAKVGAQTCKYCDVKHLCDSYWSDGGQQSLREPREPAIRSIQVLVTGKRADRVWTVIVERDPYLAPGTPAVATSTGHRVLAVGERVRLVDIRVTADPEKENPVLHVGPGSEVFAVPT